uniref:Exosome complex component RRP45 n=2 Tax=Glossina morsitans morsitans TaxID=37546 RepID=A0A1B0GAB0_GLOMM
MKETPLSLCEKNFVIQAIKQNQRLDGRNNDELRSLRINYGSDWGSVIVALGETKVLAQVSSELGEPKATRPNEGILHINVELGPMAASHFEAGRNCELTVQINRTLERTFKDSRAIDLESLCVISDERVWMLRVDLNVLNHEGNLIDCCSVATLCALAHFRRPDVSVIEDEIRIHTSAEKEPLKMVMHHYPVCVSYVVFDGGRIAIADPTVAEERTSDTQMIFGINSFGELCCLNLGGSSLTSPTLLLQCSKKAAKHAKSVVNQVKKSLENDSEAREAGKKVGFAGCLHQNTITSLGEDRLVLKLRNFTFNDINEDVEPNIKIVQGKLYSNPHYKPDIKWIPEAASDNSIPLESDTDGGENLQGTVKECLKRNDVQANFPISKQKHAIKQITSSDSEEEEKVIL